MEEKKTKKGFVKNYVLNAISFALITGTLQLVVYPFLSRIMTQSEYGIAIMLIGFTNLFTGVFALSLNNVRFRHNLEYKENNIVGDFKLLFFIGLILNVLFVFIFSVSYKSDIHFRDIILLLIMTSLAHYRIYFSICYRLNLDFKKLLIMSFFVCAGYLGGAWFANITGIWQVSFISGELLGSVYVFFTCSTVKESTRKTKMFTKTSAAYFSFILMSVFTSIPLYADRLIIYPLLSSEDVATYYVAVFYGKTIGAVLTPLAEVMMSYYALQKVMSIKSFIYRSIYILIITLGFALSTLVLSRWVTGIFYSNIIHQAAPYLTVANLGIILYFAITILAPALVRFCSLRMLFIVRGVSAALYLLLSVVLIKYNGLMGFCYAMIIVNLLTFISLIIIGIFSFKKSKKIKA